jgi:hypothetical protein
MSEDLEAILQRPTCSVAEFGKIMDVSKNVSYDALNRGDFQSIRVGGRIRVVTAPLRRMLGFEPAAGSAAQNRDAE